LIDKDLDVDDEPTDHGKHIDGLIARLGMDRSFTVGLLAADRAARYQSFEYDH